MHLLFILLWLAYAWSWRTLQPQSGSVALKLQAPTFRQSCEAKDVACIDDCSFLCVEPNARCVGGVCRPAMQTTVPCDQNKGGVLMLVERPVLQYTCICTNPTFYGGPECSTLVPDVCEQGLFIYRNRKNYTCLCLPPYEWVQVHDKPHCLTKGISNFAD